MTNVIYDVIREENIGLYGTAVNEYGPTLLTELYSEKTHFIYELLQNAEDAYERLNKEDTRIKSVHFELYNDRLEIRHNGIPFDEEDIKGICRLASGTKNKIYLKLGSLELVLNLFMHIPNHLRYTVDIIVSALKTTCIRIQ